jgi:hypothetical protein
VTGTRSIHDITAATLIVPLAILVASQLTRSMHTQLGAPKTPPPAPGVTGHARGAVCSTALVGPSLAVFFQAIDASVLLAVLLIATLLLLDASGASNPVCPPASAH